MTTITSVLPLPLDVMKQIVTTPDLAIEIDYSASQIKGRSALIYLTNANISNIHFTINTVEEAFELIDAYIMHKSTISIPCLIASITRILLTIKGVTLNADDESIIDNAGLIAPEDVPDYLMDETRREHLLHLLQLLDNLPTYLCTAAPDFKDVHGDPETLFPVIDSIDYVGYTFVNLLQSELFTMAYYSVPTTAPAIYFKQQFTEYAYGGKNLFEYLSNTYIVPLMGAVKSGELSASELEQLAQS